jgi:ribonuclease VapC
MFIDASALVAILCDEPESDSLLERIKAARESTTTPLAIYETVMAVMRTFSIPRHAAEGKVRRLLGAMGTDVVPITDEIGRAALDAFDRYGKGRGHPAQLNMGDCFAYGAAVTLGVPLLYKGDDFAETDLGGAP